MDGRARTATLLLALDAEAAGELLSRFDEGQRAEIVQAMLAVDYVDHATVAQVLADFEQACGRDHQAIAEPKTRVRGILAKALGDADVDAYIQEHDPAALGDPFAPLERLPSPQLASLLADEHAQTIAIVLSRLGTAKAGEVLTELPDAVSSDVVQRIVSCEQGGPPAGDARTGRGRGERAPALTSSHDPWATPESRFQLVADVLAAANRTSRDAALESVRARDPEAGARVRDLMFLFEDLASLKSDDLRKVVGALDTQVVALSLKTASDEVKEAVYGAISSRAGETLREELELLGPRPLSEVEQAQRAVVDAVLRLQAEGEIAVRRGAEEEMV